MYSHIAFLTGAVTIHNISRNSLLKCRSHTYTYLWQMYRKKTVCLSQKRGKVLLNGQAYHHLLLMPYIAFANNKHIQRPFKKNSILSSGKNENNLNYSPIFIVEIKINIFFI
jgi:hypothetical protein